MNNKALKFAPVETGEKRIELCLEGDETVIKLASWVDGLGWCGEKTMRIDADMLDEVHRLLGAARTRMRGRQEENEVVAPLTQKVVKFPVIA